MFICKDCQSKFDNVSGFMWSLGQCECCKEVKSCLDAREYKAKPSTNAPKVDVFGEKAETATNPELDKLKAKLRRYISKLRAEPTESMFDNKTRIARELEDLIR